MIQHLCAWSRVSALDDNDVVLTVPARDSAQAPSFSLSKNDHSLSELSVSAIGRVPISRESTAGGNRIRNDRNCTGNGATAAEEVVLEAYTALRV